MYVHTHVRTYIHTYIHMYIHKAGACPCTCAHMVGCFLFPITVALKVFAIIVLKCFNMLTNMEFEHTSVMSHMYACMNICMHVRMYVCMYVSTMSFA